MNMRIEILRRAKRQIDKLNRIDSKLAMKMVKIVSVAHRKDVYKK